MRSRLALLSPSRWPVRWRLAGVSAGLTFVILLVFAAVVGRLAQERLESDFENEVQTTASQLAASIQVNVDGTLTIPERLAQINLAPGEAVQIVDALGSRYLNNAPDLPDPEPQRIVDTGEFKVVSRQIMSSALSAEAPSPHYLQYARDHDQLDATIGRLWLFLGVGVAGGAILATLAGLWIAQRAMRPIAALTATAREIATTRDPSVAMPKPRAEDEVAELARTLDSMLAELDAARGEAQQMVQLQREFVADASHELRTPLTSILANLELLQESLSDATRRDSEEAEMVDSALRSSRRMRRLVGDLLMLARADAGRAGERRECDLASIAAHAVDEVLPIATEHSLELDAPTPVPVMANADELHRLTVNLLDNAVRHTPPGTRIRAAAARRGEEAVLEVADDGPGLPEGMRDQVFSRFVRGGDGPADLAAGSGTGLGLAIVRAVATSHGGHVEAGSPPAGGARFVVKLPLAADADINSKLSANV